MSLETTLAWLAWLADRAIAPIGELGWDVLLERSLAEPVAVARPQVDVTLRLATLDDAETITRLYAADPWLYIYEGPGGAGSHEAALALYVDRIRRGELCFIATCGDAIAHLNWTCYHWGDALPDHPIRLRPGEIYTTDALTTPDFRGKGLHGYVLGEMLAHARSRGVGRAYTLARVNRAATFKAFAPLGWKQCGRVVYFRRRTWNHAWFLWRDGNVEPLFRPA